MRKDKPAGPVETFIAIAFCVIPIIYFVVSNVQTNDGEPLASQKLSPNPSEADSSNETIQDEISASYCYEIRSKPSHPKYQTCLDVALLCSEFLKEPSHQYYNDCKARGWSVIVDN